MKKALEEQEKRKKGKKKDDEPDVDPSKFKHLPNEMLVEMIKERASSEDCNAGVIFDNLESENYSSSKVGIEAICEALPHQDLQAVVLNFQKDEEDGQEVCTNFRYHMRKLAKEESEAQKEKEALMLTQSKIVKAKKTPRGKEGKKGDDKNEEEKQAEDKKLEEDEKNEGPQ